MAYDTRSLIFSGKRELLIAGELHYARSTRAMWPSLLDCSKALGLNGIATYVFWNFHEPERDVYDFSGDRDLGRFLELCKEARFTSSFAADPAAAPNGILEDFRPTCGMSRASPRAR